LLGKPLASSEAPSRPTGRVKRGSGAYILAKGHVDLDCSSELDVIGLVAWPTRGALQLD
jgi:hypothetical protein